MSYNKNISPVDWYVASYLLRFVELSDDMCNDPEKKFLAWENTVLVQASSLTEAYEKAVKIGESASAPYKGGTEGVPVKWAFEGITQLLPIYEALEDGAEIMWAEHAPRKLKNLRKMVHTKECFEK